ncbi:hypothetical protein [Bosea sp. (in: a-proteobacteria)]|jgi:hypothetical protein|uniref:hypothetical protein n=1 Tax=Bosea sp. (in: a-proteobacteria) TaxID=1871050 RepID=UPI001AC81344|nr:hypothetical protein [Bosea sp. (in: a-proteobacteria)]MBN9440813.1 hypothetical protein [Bosea sp. (in: a-proteobacteria)]MBN9467259.1 hypothetical protein [Bosea sp. (in: a-proteobacteria)]
MPAIRMDGGFFFANLSAIAWTIVVDGTLIVETAIKLLLISAGMLGVAGATWLIAEKWKL